MRKLLFPKPRLGRYGLVWVLSAYFGISGIDSNSHTYSRDRLERPYQLNLLLCSQIRGFTGNAHQVVLNTMSQNLVQ